MIVHRALPALLFTVLASSACTVPLKDPGGPILPVHTPRMPPRPGPVVSVFPGPSLVIEKVDGIEAARAHAAMAALPVAVRECHPGAGGVVRLRVDAASGKAAYTLEPSTSLDPLARRCVLEALSTVDIEGISGDPSPSARPSGFTAQFRFEW